MILGLGRSPGEGKRYALQYSGLENSTGCILHGVARNRTRLSDFQFHFHFDRGRNQESTTKLCQGQEFLSGCYTANSSKCLQRTLPRSQSAAFQAPGNSWGTGQTGNCILQLGHRHEGSMTKSKHMVVAKLGARKSSTACL